MTDANPEAYSPVPQKKRSPWRAFWDFFVLFSGISTESNLSRTQSRPVRGRGVFLFRPRAEKTSDGTPQDGTTDSR